MTEPAHPTPDELREQAETDTAGVLGDSFAERTQRLIDRHGLDVDTARAAVLDAERGHDTEHARLAAREARAALEEIHTHFRAGFRALAERVTEQVRHVSEQFAQLKEAIQQLPEPACAAHGTPARRRDRPAWQSPYGPALRRR